MADTNDTRCWEHILTTLTGDNSKNCPKFVALMLNHCFDNLHLYKDKSFLTSKKFRKFLKIWNEAHLRFTVDGGTNYLFDLQQTLKSQQSTSLLKNPDFVSGDFDSIRPNVLQHFKANPNTSVVDTPDQDATDFTKALLLLSKQHLSQQSVEAIYVFGTNSGRIDQFLSILSTMYDFCHEEHSKIMPKILLVDLNSSISFVLNKGKHIIPIYPMAKWCSLVPLNGPVTLSTTGFRWNLTNDVLEFGKFISTSNQFSKDAHNVTVTCFNKPILFSFDFE